MNRRRFFAFFGIGSAGSLMPKLWAKPSHSGWYAEGLSKKLLDAQVEKKLNSLHGVSDLQKSLLRLRTLKPFLEKARLTSLECQDIVDSISVESGIAAEADWHESLTRTIKKSSDEFKTDMDKLALDIRDDKLLSMLPETIKTNRNHFDQFLHDFEKLNYPDKVKDRSSLVRLHMRLFSPKVEELA